MSIYDFKAWVLRASTVGFTVGCRNLPREVPHFGDLVRVPIQGNTINIFGLIYDVEVRDDPAVRQLILAGEVEPEVMQDQRENRLVPTEISVLVVGYEQEGVLLQSLPPQPPISLDTLIICDDDDIRRFTRRHDGDEFIFDYIQLVLNAPQVPAEELLAANLRRASRAYAPEVRRRFLLGAGREIARLLSFDLMRLDTVLRRIKQMYET